MTARPGSVVKFCKTVLPLLHGKSDGRRILQDVREVVAADRWNSFDRFADTTAFLVRRYEESGAKAEVHTMRTGGAIGSGRWIIHKAADVRSATMDVIRPVKTRVLDYGQNPWHVIQWSDATPPGGMENELAVVDSKEALTRIPRGGLAGKVVLTAYGPTRHVAVLLGGRRGGGGRRSSRTESARRDRVDEIRVGRRPHSGCGDPDGWPGSIGEPGKTPARPAAQARLIDRQDRRGHSSLPGHARSGERGCARRRGSPG